MYLYGCSLPDRVFEVQTQTDSGYDSLWMATPYSFIHFKVKVRFCFDIFLNWRDLDGVLLAELAYYHRY